MKTKLTPKIQEEIIKYIRGGNYIETACNAVGVCRKTYYNWLQRGAIALRLEEKGEKVPENEKIFLHFLHTTQQAVAKAEIRNVTIIQMAAKKDWHAAMEILARKYPKRWGKKDKLAPETPKAPEPLRSKAYVEFQKEEKKLTPEQRKQLVAFAIKAEKEFKEQNTNNGDSKNG